MNFGDSRLPARFWSKVAPCPMSGCWIWTGGVTVDGYGRFKIGGRSGAHRISYRALVGDVPPGLQLDHLCRVRCCVNPTHLEAVSQRENIIRGRVPKVTAARHAEIKHCPAGHLYTPDNVRMKTHRHRNGKLYQTRDCRTCHRNRERSRRKVS